MWVKEENGDFHYSLRTRNLSEEGIFVERKMRAPDQEPFSRLSFLLPGGKTLRNITARMVREQRDGSGAAYEFMNLSEEARIELKRYLLERSLAS